MSNNPVAVVVFPLLCFAGGGRLVRDLGGDDRRWYDSGSWRQKHGFGGVRGFENAGSIIP